MKIFLFLFLSWGFFNLTFGQTDTISGSISNASNMEALPFATIEIFSLHTGTIADKNGNFILLLPALHANTDSLFVSHLGFQSRKISIADFLNQNNTNIALKLNEIVLDEVLVLPRKYKTIKQGVVAKKPDRLQVTNIFNNKIGNFFENTKNKLAWLKTVSFYIGEEGHPETPFRIRIYNLNQEKNCPGNDLLNENVIVAAKESGWFFVDLSLYNIQVPKEGFFVTMEWINSGKEFYYDKEIDERNESGEIVKVNRKFYGQSIGSIVKQPDMITWGISLGNDWLQYTPFYKGYINAMIQAEIAYPEDQ